MALRKYMKVEDQKVASPAQHKAVDEELRKQGKRSAQDLDPAERQSLTERLEASN